MTITYWALLSSSLYQVNFKLTQLTNYLLLGINLNIFYWPYESKQCCHLLYCNSRCNIGHLDHTCVRYSWHHGPLILVHHPVTPLLITINQSKWIPQHFNHKRKWRKKTKTKPFSSIFLLSIHFSGMLINSVVLPSGITRLTELLILGTSNFGNFFFWLFYMIEIMFLKISNRWVKFIIHPSLIWFQDDSSIRCKRCWRGFD